MDVEDATAGCTRSLADCLQARLIRSRGIHRGDGSPGLLKPELRGMPAGDRRLCLLRPAWLPRSELGRRQGASRTTNKSSAAKQLFGAWGWPLSGPVSTQPVPGSQHRSCAALAPLLRRSCAALAPLLRRLGSGRCMASLRSRARPVHFASGRARSMPTADLPGSLGASSLPTAPERARHRPEAEIGAP